MVQNRQRKKEKQQKGPPHKERQPLRSDCLNLQNACDLEGIYSEYDDEDDGEDSGDCEEIGRDRVLGVIVFKDDPVGDFVLFEIPEVHS